MRFMGGESFPDVRRDDGRQYKWLPLVRTTGTSTLDIHPKRAGAPAAHPGRVRQNAERVLQLAVRDVPTRVLLVSFWL